ncbi:hypothetical protein CGRA01v4_00046 [Colletotrichum graminicola]|uniref:SnoaL-like domain-containing protein n=1 Tax=Colletotrichum graminicola (strain M1.001 / M2 / FGSC 10212) TaxID=645133 RepID=E3QXA0_COLGM|nr:uncharacterized protein GLRG_10632 [Colletotrichum graminicola M1.001]EFQ35488.1 hypothetical protein GLRG_10632 [Colletotrichum graminicola M1.001]WDK08768.1 hypothetical protein CGRA01v4_00046 [Colletotrichum graminicola]
MTRYDQDAHAVFVEQVSGELRDRPLRATIDSKIRHLFKCFDDENWDGMRAHLSPSVILIDQLDGPEDIYTHTEDIMSWFEEFWHPNQHTAHQLLLVDRGRVTCYVTHFWMNDECFVFIAEQEVYIIDLDDRHQVRRFERRRQERHNLDFH